MAVPVPVEEPVPAVPVAVVDPEGAVVRRVIEPLNLAENIPDLLDVLLECNREYRRRETELTDVNLFENIATWSRVGRPEQHLERLFWDLVEVALTPSILQMDVDLYTLRRSGIFVITYMDDLRTLLNRDDQELTPVIRAQIRQEIIVTFLNGLQAHPLYPYLRVWNYIGLLENHYLTAATPEN